MLRHIFTLLLIFTSITSVMAGDWTEFRGPARSGISADSKLPTTWSNTENLKWKIPLPGPGSSSPVVSGDRVFVTSFSGSGNSLKRHLVCVDHNTGKVLWEKAIANEQREDAYRGYITEHGYASNTPVTDGESVFVFFGKTGALAFNMSGKQLWKENLGTESSNRRWGSGASPILYKDMVIFNAADESQSLRALDKKTGKEKWKAEARSFELCYNTPALAKQDDGSSQLVISVPGEVWGMNPDTGKLSWYASTRLTGNVSPSVIVDKNIAYMFGGYQSSGSHAYKIGGKGDVTDKNHVWTSRETSYVSTPLLYNGHFYWVTDRGQACCSNAKTGESVYRTRLRGVSAGGRPFYASPVLSGGKLYVVSRWDGTFVFEAKTEFKQLGVNKFDGDDSDFSGTPAISGNSMFIRSGKYLYCVANDE